MILIINIINNELLGCKIITDLESNIYSGKETRLYISDASLIVKRFTFVSLNQFICIFPI